MIKLDKALCVFDLETTGTNLSNDRIVEIAIVKVLPNGEREELHELVNPEMIIPDEVSEIHGISNKDVATKPTFEMLADAIIDFIGDADLGGFHSNQFDIPILLEEFNRVGKTMSMQGRRLLDARAIFHKMEPRNLSAAYQFYCNKELINAHSALADTRATTDVLLAQALRYKELDADPDKMNQYSRSGNKVDFAGRFAYRGDEVVFNFGKHKGKTLAQVLAKEPGYYSWMMNADFTVNTKDVLRQEKEKLEG